MFLIKAKFLARVNGAKLAHPGSTCCLLCLIIHEVSNTRLCYLVSLCVLFELLCPENNKITCKSEFYVFCPCSS